MDNISNYFLLCMFWLSLFVCVATYVVYPSIIYVFSKFIPFKVDKKDFYPLVSIVISAYNEQQHIAEKIINTISLDYPKDKMEIIIGSDGSIDKTVEIARKYVNQGVKILSFSINRGKTAVQNECVKISRGEILIFTDAASFLNRDAIKKIVRNFSDTRIGCVAGRLRFIKTETNITTESQGLYWRYELKMREMESNLGRLIGVDGPLYAIRRSLYVPLLENIISDLISPLIVLYGGKRVVLEQEATVSEEPTLKTNQEFTTRRRITLRALVALTVYSQLLNPFKHPILALQIIFHKLFRWFVGPLVIINLLSCLALSGYTFFKVISIAYVLLFISSTIGLFISFLGIKWRILNIPYYFMLVNIAATFGIIDFFRNKQAIVWKPVRS